MRFALDAPQKTGWVELGIRDNGAGVPPDQQETLLSKFSRGWSEGSDLHASSGLGLAISKQIMHQLGGELELAETGRDGLVLVVQLKLAEVDKATEESDAAPE